MHEDAHTNTVTTTFELPGLAKEDVSIDVHDHVLTVSGESKMSAERDENGYAVRERRYGRFSRAVPLPQGIKVCLVWFGVIASRSRADEVFCRLRISRRRWKMASLPSPSPSLRPNWRRRRLPLPEPSREGLYFQELLSLFDLRILLV